MPAKAKSSKTSSAKKPAKATAAAAKRGAPARKPAASLSLAQFLKSAPKRADGHTAVFLINPSESTAETLRVAWPETCASCGHWFDFPTAAVESVIPLGAEQCCTEVFPKAGVKIKSAYDSLAEMLRAHLAGDLEVQLSPTSRALGSAVETCNADVALREAVAAVGAAAGELSGPAWVARFPTSRSLFDLKPPFLDNATKFHNALLAAGAAVRISATLRPPERAYLMHHSFRIAKEGEDPRTVPRMAGVNIQWFHGDLPSSKRAAQQMVDAYGIAFRPALNSNHTLGLAVDMTITWSGTLRIKDATGTTRSIGAPASGAANAALHTVGRTYGVIKLASDPPHWSSDGH